MSKTLLVLMVGMLAIGCLTPEQKLRGSVVGTYEFKLGKNTYRQVFLENGNVESNKNGKKFGEEGKWKLVNGELYDFDINGNTGVHRINKDGSLTIIAIIHRDGKREEAPKGKIITLKKIK